MHSTVLGAEDILENTTDHVLTFVDHTLPMWKTDDKLKKE